MTATLRLKLALPLLYLAALPAFAEAQEDTLSSPPDTAARARKGVVLAVLNYFRNSNKESDKRFDCSVVGGPYYNATTSFGIGGGVSGLYSWDPSDSTLRRSSLSVMAMVSVKGIVALEVRGTNYMKKDRSRWNYRLKVSNTPMDFWGIGYNHGINDATKGKYKQIKVQFKPDYLFRIAKDFYLGFLLNVDCTHTYEFSNPELIYGQRESVAAVGAGVALNYDSRDVSTNAYRGQYLRAEQLFYPKFANKYYFNATDVTFSTYHPLWRSAVFAAEYHSLFNFGDNVPWTMLALVAETTNRMRGYYEGRYRDRNIIEAQVEIRQRLPRRFGVVAFAGAANVFPEFDEINMRHTLPNYGVGARWEFKQRVNIRLDFGFTKNKPGVVFNINEAF